MRALLAVVCLPLLSCVEPLDGSRINMWLAASVQIPAEDDAALEPGQPPSGTHYEMYLESKGRLFLLTTFAIAPIVDPAAKCFIENDTYSYPLIGGDPTGLHSASWYNKLLELYLADGTIDDDEAEQLYLARKRVDDQQRLHDAVKAMVSSASYTTQELAEIESLLAAVPPPEAMDDASNAERWARCNELFSRFPKLYVGYDRPLSWARAGQLYGPVDGIDPRSGLPFGGATITVPGIVVGEFDSLRINWNFINPDDPRRPEWESTHGPSTTGYHYLAGVPVERTREIRAVGLENSTYGWLTGEVVVFSGLADDDVHF